MTAGTRTWKVDYFPIGESIGVELDNVLDVRVTRAGENSANTGELVLTTTGGRGIVEGEITYKADDTIKIYAAEGEVVKSNDDHLVGVFTIQDIVVSTEARTLSIKMIDKTYDILSKIWVGDVTDTVPNLISNVYQTITNNRSALTNIATTRSDTSAFPSVQYFAVNKTAYEVITELSQPNFTGDDRTYMFWVDELEKLHWIYPGQTTEAQEFIHAQSPVINMKFGKAESTVVSMIIYNAGKDKNGNDYVDFYLAANANTIKGQMRYDEMLYLSKDLQQTSFWSASTNEQVQTELKSRADDNCRRIVSQIGTGLWEANVSIKGKKYTYGGLYNVQSNLHGFPLTKLRLVKVIHTMNKNGWETKLTLMQDAEALQ